MAQPKPENQNSSRALIGGFYIAGSDGKKKVKPELFDAKAQEIANRFYKETINRFNQRPVQVGVSGTQLRRVFDEVKRFDYLLQLDSESWDAQLPYIKMIKSKIRYTIARMTRNERNQDVLDCYAALSSFLIEGIDAIHEQQDYEVFLALFEAVYGFYYEHAPNRS
ncbi:MAG: type III-A CRISPR-associated protein Csm2 [Spirochaetales bacterium]|nr:type III-A CRISPR-associated protein Csm2 [Spirochaetales bacterium]